MSNVEKLMYLEYIVGTTTARNNNKTKTGRHNNTQGVYSSILTDWQTNTKDTYFICNKIKIIVD
jgi:hypothetical protein